MDDHQNINNIQCSNPNKKQKNEKTEPKKSPIPPENPDLLSSIVYLYVCIIIYNKLKYLYLVNETQFKIKI